MKRQWKQDRWLVLLLEPPGISPSKPIVIENLYLYGKHLETIIMPCRARETTKVAKVLGFTSFGLKGTLSPPLLIS